LKEVHLATIFALTLITVLARGVEDAEK